MSDGTVVIHGLCVIESTDCFSVQFTGLIIAQIPKFWFCASILSVSFQPVSTKNFYMLERVQRTTRFYLVLVYEDNHC